MSFLPRHSHEEAFDAFRKHFSVRSPEGDVDFAAEIVKSFSRIPYENISKIIKNSTCPTLEDKVRLPLEVIEDHIERNLGGTCFSLTFFLESLFKNSGFSCYKIMADMKSGDNVHCAVVLTIGRRKFLADPGYSVNTLLPMDGPLVRTKTTAFGGIELQFKPDENRYHLFTFRSDEKKWRYRFRDVAVSDADFERYWAESFDKPTLDQICLYRPTPDGLLYVHNNHVRLTSYATLHRERIEEGLDTTIQKLFGIDSRLVEEAQTMLSSGRAPGPG